MSGRPKFTRAKRITYFHTSHKSIYDGSETQHVKSDLTASVDGNYAITADQFEVTGNASIDGDLDVTGALTIGGEFDLNQNKIVNVENVIRSVKRTVGYAELTASSRVDPQNVGIYRASPGDTVVDVVANVTTAFAGASLMGTGLKAIMRTHFSVGELGATGGFRTTIVPGTDTGWRWMQQHVSTGASVGSYLKSIHATPLTRHYRSGTMVNANFRASEIHLASLDAGSVDFYVDVISRS